MIELTNKNLEQAMITIAGFDKDGKVIAGLMTEKISLGLKRRLQKLHKELSPKYQEYLQDRAQIETECKDEKKEAELKLLDEEAVKIDLEFLSLAMIEAIDTEAIYDFDVIEKFAK